MLDGQMPPVELKLLASVANPVNLEMWDAYPVKYVQAISFEHTLDKANLDYVCEFVVHHPDWYLSTQLQKIYGVR